MVDESAAPTPVSENNGGPAPGDGDAAEITTRMAVALLGLSLVLRLVSLIRLCLSDDEAIYCVVSREILAGRVLYRDVVDHKPPLIYLTYAVTQALGGPSDGMRLLHLLTILVVWGTALMLARVARIVYPSDEPSAPFVAAVLYSLFTTTLLDFDSLAANCELFMLLPLTTSVLLYLTGLQRGRTALFLASGACVGLAMFYKYQAAIHFPLYAGHLIFTHRRNRSKAISPLIAMSLGLAAVLVLGAAIMIHGSSLGAAWFWFRFNFSYIAAGLEPMEVLGRAVTRVSFIVGVASFLWVLGIAAAAQGMTALPTRCFASAWLIASLIAVTAGGRFFGHYFHQVTAPLAVLAAPSAARMWRRRRAIAVAWIGVPVVAFFLVTIFHARVMAAAGEPDPDYKAMADFITAHSKPADRLAVWGNSPVLYFEADRPLGSRFVFSNYLTGLSPATRSQSDPNLDTSRNIVPESWDMFEEDLSTRRPALFVDLSVGDVAGYGKFPPAHFPRLNTILNRDYLPIGDVAGARIFERRAAADQ